MALLRLSCGQSGEIRPGDVVFDTRAHEKKYPVHVGVYIGPKRMIDKSENLEVQGLPIAPKVPPYVLGKAMWGAPKQYQPDEVGKRLDLDEATIAQVALLAESLENERSQLPIPIEWNKNKKMHETKKIRDGIPLFLRGSCAHYVEYLYGIIGYSIVDELKMCDPDKSGWIHPMTQMHAFYTGKYKLSIAWDPKLGQWPECIFGQPSTTT